MKFFVIIFLCTVIMSCKLLLAHPVEDQVQNPSEENARAQRHAHHDHHDDGHDDAVDFGAHTGDHGAFGWHAHFPVRTDH
ncbi:hypothetical protein NQ315_005862 [Exocentrus adspersus]|uniref:Uncharacterized protein n=1 Tax=Exocentrus adspersus TaxID=1586481 RepID=A0AAV8VRZ7_9CUCU|nr:hypothetical protein NQ315_005862 [Exocentrus adspersus]